ncbi:MAG: hypothetical protein K2Q34_06420 [Alphaproteobacteria bacterium]|nr:hypothetical protein [Alphaproteobacteria bacterium]
MRFIIKTAIVSVVALLSICSVSNAMDDHEELTIASMSKHLPSAADHMDGLLKDFSDSSSARKSRRPTDKVALVWGKPEETSKLFLEVKARLGLGPKDTVRIEQMRLAQGRTLYCIYNDLS